MGNETNGLNDNDGWDKRGGGLIQHTGRAEFDTLFARLGVTPEQIHGGDPVAMVRACCDYWDRVGANAYCDRGDFRGLRRRVNGGTIGVDEVAARRARSLSVVAGAA
jgi:putative chitinase